MQLKLMKCTVRVDIPVTAQVAADFLVCQVTVQIHQQGRGGRDSD